MLHRWLKIAVLNLLLVSSSAIAWDARETFGISESFVESYLAYREDSFKWKVKGKRDNPLIVQEFCFNDVKMIEKGIRSEITLCGAWTLKADGKFAMAYNRAHDWAYDLSFAAGYHFDFCNNSIRVTPLLGYAVDEQHLHSCNDRYLSDKSSADPITLARLDSFYRAFWRSGWIGVDVDYAINECWKTYSNLAYHFVNLRGKGHTKFGDRNLNDFQARDRFRTRTTGWGFTWDVGLQYAIDCNWLIDLGTQFEFRKVNRGHQKSRHSYKGWNAAQTSDSDSDSDSDIKNRLSRVEWRSLRVAVGLSYRF